MHQPHLTLHFSGYTAKEKQMNTDCQRNFVVESDPAHERRVLAQFHLEVMEAERLSEAAHERAAPAFARLLELAETRDSGQIRRVAQFIAATFNGSFHFDLFELRALDQQIGDDMLACLDCLRWGTSDLYRLVPDGMERVERVIKLWGLK